MWVAFGNGLELNFSLTGRLRKSMDWPSQCQKKDRTIFRLSSHTLFPLLSPQVVYFTEMHKIFSDLTDQIDQAGLTDEQRERETEAKLSELRALSIVADDWRRKAENREGLLWCLSEWTALFSGSFAHFWTDRIWLSACFLVASSTLIPLALHSHVSYSDSTTQSSWNATLTKPLAKCNIVSQYVWFFFFFFSDGIHRFLSELTTRVTLLVFSGV